MAEKRKNFNPELIKMNEELKAEIIRHKETMRLLEENKQFLAGILSNALMLSGASTLVANSPIRIYKGTHALSDSRRIGKSALEIYKGTEVETFLRKVLNDEIQNDILDVYGVIYDTRVSPIFDPSGQKTVIWAFHRYYRPHKN
jgi:hypothetical protein